jgi:hypothetical protein
LVLVVLAHLPQEQTERTRYLVPLQLLAVAVAVLTMAALLVQTEHLEVLVEVVTVAGQLLVALELQAKAMLEATVVVR